MSIPSLKALCLEKAVNMDPEEYSLILPGDLIDSLGNRHKVTVSKKRMGFLFDLKNAGSKEPAEFLTTIPTIAVVRTFWMPHDSTIADLKRRVLEAYQPIYQKIGLSIKAVKQEKQIFKLGDKFISRTQDNKYLVQFTKPKEDLSVTINTSL